MDTRQPRRLNGPGAASTFAVVVVAAVLSIARPVAAADPLLPSSPVPLPSLPVALPSVPLPTLLPLPVPTPKLPTVTPLPTLRVPTLPPLPTPSLPIGSPGPSASASATLPSTASLVPGSSVAGGGPLDPGATFGGPGGPIVGASEAPPVDVPTVGGSSLFDAISVPGLIVGVPLIVLLGILATQVAVGAAWLPVIRRWLNRRV